MITLKEIAELSNVSVATVSNILNGKSKASKETTERVLEIAKQTGYKPNYIARNLRNKRTREIAIVAEDITLFSTPIMVESIMQYCESRGYRVSLQNLRMYARWQDTWYDKDSAFRSILDPTLQEVLSMRVDGLIYLAGHARDIRCFDGPFPIPAVMAYGYAENPGVPSVVIDDQDGGYQMTKYLIEKGHKRIGIAAGRADNMHCVQRLLGYQKALFEAGIPYNPAWVEFGEWDKANGYEYAKKMEGEKLDAIFAFADQIACGVIDYIIDQGKTVEETMSVVGFDNQNLSEYIHPSLTTMAIQLEEIGIKAAELLCDKLENPEMEENEDKEDKMVISVPCKLIERDSVRTLVY